MVSGGEDCSSAVTFEGCRQSLMDTVLHFMTEERAKLREAAADKAAAEAAVGVAAPAPVTESPQGSDRQQLLCDYQRKVSPSERAVLLADVLEAAAVTAPGEDHSPVLHSTGCCFKQVYDELLS